jgi:hypothetical protein
LFPASLSSIGPLPVAITNHQSLISMSRLPLSSAEALKQTGPCLDKQLEQAEQQIPHQLVRHFSPERHSSPGGTAASNLQPGLRG